MKQKRSEAEISEQQQSPEKKANWKESEVEEQNPDQEEDRDTDEDELKCHPIHGFLFFCFDLTFAFPLHLL